MTEQLGPCGCSRRPLGPHQMCHVSLGTVYALAATGPHGNGSFVGRVPPLALANCDGVSHLLLSLSGHLPVPGMLEWPHSHPSPPGPCSVCGHQASPGFHAECCSSPGIHSCQHSLSCWQRCCLESGKAPFPLPYQPVLQGKSWSLSAMQQKRLSVPPVRKGNISQAGPRRSTVLLMISVKAVSAPCDH